MDYLVKDRVAVIPARGGSKRLPKKNILEFKGKPMIAWTIEAALESKLFDVVLVSTDSEEIAKVAKKHGAYVPFLRNANADDYSTVSQATMTALHQLRQHNGRVYKTVVQLMANCPLRTTKEITQQLNLFEKSKHKNSLLSGFKYGMFNPWWAHYKDNEGNLKRLHNEKDENTRSQDLKELLCPSGATWITTVESLEQYQTFYSPGYNFHELSWLEALDIDDVDDLNLAKAAFKLKYEKL